MNSYSRTLIVPNSSNTFWSCKHPSQQ